MGHCMPILNICQALLESITSPLPGEIVNLTDDMPTASHLVDFFAAELLHAPKPRLIPYENAALSPMAKAFYASNKRVSNTKLKKYFLAQLRYPTYKEGLKSILLEESIV